MTYLQLGEIDTQCDRVRTLLLRRKEEKEKEALSENKLRQKSYREIYRCFYSSILFCQAKNDSFDLVFLILCLIHNNEKPKVLKWHVDQLKYFETCLHNQ